MIITKQVKTVKKYFLKISYFSVFKNINLFSIFYFLVVKYIFLFIFFLKNKKTIDKIPIFHNYFQTKAHVWYVYF